MKPHAPVGVFFAVNRRADAPRADAELRAAAGQRREAAALGHSGRDARAQVWQVGSCEAEQAMKETKVWRPPCRRKWGKVGRGAEGA